MPLVPSVLGLTSRASGSLALGLFLNGSSPLPINNYFQYWWQHMSGGCSGAKSMFCLALTTMRGPQAEVEDLKDSVPHATPPQLVALCGTL